MVSLTLIVVVWDHSEPLLFCKFLGVLEVLSRPCHNDVFTLVIY